MGQMHLSMNLKRISEGSQTDLKCKQNVPEGKLHLAINISYAKLAYGKGGIGSKPIYLPV